MLGKISTSQVTKSSSVSSEKKQASANSTTNMQTATSSKNDVVEINKKTANAGVYKKPNNRLSASEMNAIKAEAERINESLRTLVEKVIAKQGKYKSLSVSEETFTENDFSVETVSDNIVNFAIAISGDDPSKLDELKAAIDKGFREAEKCFGGTLPDICYKTHDVIMEKLDAWKNGKS